MNLQEFRKRFQYSIRTDKIGGGSFGSVYKVYDNLFDTYKALKIGEVKQIGDKEYSLTEEFAAVSGLPVHRNIANYEAVHQFETDTGIYDYAIMQYYSDGNLARLLADHPLSLNQKLDIAKGILKGIGFLHSNRVLHRDLKPSNILISTNRNNVFIPKITDFGLSKLYGGDASAWDQSFEGGTIEYTSPEQLKGEKVSFNSDLWSYGVLLFELFEGRKPFYGGNNKVSPDVRRLNVLTSIINGDMEDYISCPSSVQEVINHCLIVNSSKRVKSCDQLNTQLDAIDVALLQDNVPIVVAEEIEEFETDVLGLYAIDPLNKASDKSLINLGGIQKKKIEARLEAERKAREEAAEQARIEAERKAQEEAAEQARIEAERKAEEEAAEQARIEAERKAQEEAAEQARLEAERKAQEEAAEQARIESERKAQEEAAEQARIEAERKAQEEAAEQARIEAERKAEEEAAEQARIESERKAQEEAAEQARIEAERRAQEEAAEQARIEAERKAQEEAAEQARIESERKAQEEAAEQARIEAERKAEEEAAEQARIEAERKAQVEAAEQTRIESERKAQEEAAEQARIEAERKAQEEAAEQARIEAERNAQEEAAEQARIEAERKAQEEAAEQARIEAEHKAQEEAAEQARLEAERKSQEEAAEQARIEAERKAQEEAAEQSKLEIERKAREDAAEQARLEVQRKAQEEAAEQARLEAEKRAQAKAAKQARLESEKKAKENAKVQARREAEQKAQRKTKEQLRIKAEQKAKKKLVVQAEVKQHKVIPIESLYSKGKSKKRNALWLLLIIFLFGVVSTIAYKAFNSKANADQNSNEISLYQKVVYENKKDGYEKFLSLYPNSHKNHEIEKLLYAVKNNGGDLDQISKVQDQDATGDDNQNIENQSEDLDSETGYTKLNIDTGLNNTDLSDLDNYNRESSNPGISLINNENEPYNPQDGIETTQDPIGKTENEFSKDHNQMHELFDIKNKDVDNVSSEKEGNATIEIDEENQIEDEEFISQSTITQVETKKEIESIPSNESDITDEVANPINEERAAAPIIASDFINKVDADFVKVEGGWYTLGCDDKKCGINTISEKKVQVKPFYISKYEVTQKLYKEVTGKNPSFNKTSSRNPVENITLEEISFFLSLINSQEGNPYTYRLPTEAEWEFAASGGSTNIYSGGNEARGYGNFKGESRVAAVAPVGRFRKNQYQIADMSGNIAEVTADIDIESKGRKELTYNVVKGGSWINGEDAAKIKSRNFIQQGQREIYIGFRLVRE